mmetsp:Transcript_14120/g.33651  ORF Transcript_14120/g.33651 Transcript_14120/m.33651 type:complete len:97 (-) Transcript_14120:615-905(-)
MCASVSVSTSRRHMADLGLMLLARDGFPRQPFPTIRLDQRRQMRLQVHRGVPVVPLVPEHSLQAASLSSPVPLLSRVASTELPSFPGCEMQDAAHF